MTEESNTATANPPPQQAHPLWNFLTTTSSAKLNYVRALLYGQSGIGKTTSVRTLPVSTTDAKGTEWATLVLNTERSTIPLADRKYATIPIDSWGKAEAIVPALMSGAMPDGRRIHTVVIDSLTGLSDLCKVHIVETDRPALLAARSKGNAHDAALSIYEDQMGMEDWGAYGRRMKQLISAITRLPANVVMLSLEAWTLDKKTNRRWTTPALNGKLALECPADFDLVMHMSARGEAGDEENDAPRFWQTFNDGAILAKDASGTLNPFEAPDWPSVLKTVRSAQRRVTTTTTPEPTEAQPNQPTTTEDQ